MHSQFHSEPSSYLAQMRADVPRYDELQDQAIAAIPFAPRRVLELGIGTAETTRRIVAAYPDAQITGLDSSPEMVFRAREMLEDVQLARMEDPLPDGPWDLVISVLSVHHLTDEQKQLLFRRVREQSSSLVLGDVVKAATQVASLQPGVDFPDRAEELADWCGGRVTWSADDLAVVAADYRE